jgi:hypothetical protein
LYGERGGGVEGHPRPPKATRGNSPRLGPGARTIRRCPVYWAAANFPTRREITIERHHNPAEALAPDTTVGPPGGLLVH